MRHFVIVVYSSLILFCSVLVVGADPLDARGNDICDGAVSGGAGAEFLVTSLDPGHQSSPSVSALSDGRFVVTWMSGDQQDLDTLGSAIKARLFCANGVAIGDEFLVNSRYTRNQSWPTVVGLSDGGFVITWYSTDREDDDKSDSAVKAQIYNKDAMRVGGEFLVNIVHSKDQYFPRVAALDGGGFAITWTSRDSESYGIESRLIKAKIYDAMGNIVKDEYLVNDEYEGRQLLSSLTQLDNGNIVFTWFSSRIRDTRFHGYDIKAKIYSSKGDEIGKEFLVNSIEKGNQVAPRIASLNDGGFVITWNFVDYEIADYDKGVIKARMYDENGLARKVEFIVNGNRAYEQITSDVAGLADGGFVVTWRLKGVTTGQPTESEIKARIFDKNGAAPGVGFLVNQGDDIRNRNPAITVLEDDGFVILWDFSNRGVVGKTKASVRARIFN